MCTTIVLYINRRVQWCSPCDHDSCHQAWSVDDDATLVPSPSLVVIVNVVVCFVAVFVAICIIMVQLISDGGSYNWLLEKY